MKTKMKMKMKMKMNIKLKMKLKMKMIMKMKKNGGKSETKQNETNGRWLSSPEYYQRANTPKLIQHVHAKL